MSEEAKKEKVELTTSEKVAADILGFAANLGASVLICSAAGMLVCGLKGHKIMQTLGFIGGVGLSLKLGDDAEKAMQKNMMEVFESIERLKLVSKKIAEAKAKKGAVHAEGEIA